MSFLRILVFSIGISGAWFSALATDGGLADGPAPKKEGAYPLFVLERNSCFGSLLERGNKAFFGVSRKHPTVVAHEEMQLRFASSWVDSRPIAETLFADFLRSHKTYLELLVEKSLSGTRNSKLARHTLDALKNRKATITSDQASLFMRAFYLEGVPPGRELTFHQNLYVFQWGNYEFAATLIKDLYSRQPERVEYAKLVIQALMTEAQLYVLGAGPWLPSPSYTGKEWKRFEQYAEDLRESPSLSDF